MGPGERASGLQHIFPGPRAPGAAERLQLVRHGVEEKDPLQVRQLVEDRGDLPGVPSRRNGETRLGMRHAKEDLALFLDLDGNGNADPAGRQDSHLGRNPGVPALGKKSDPLPLAEPAGEEKSRDAAGLIRDFLERRLHPTLGVPLRRPGLPGMGPGAVPEKAKDGSSLHG